MTPNEFILLVTKMRETQKAYFKAPAGPEKWQLLETSRKLEKQVDDQINNTKDTQIKMF